MFRGRVVMMPKLRFLLIAGVSALGILHSMSAGAADRSKSRTQRLASGPALGKGNGSFYIGLDYNPTFNGIKDLKIIGETDEDEMDVLTGARGLFPMNALASNVTDFNSYHFDWSTPLPGLEFGNSTLALGGSIGYRIGGARVEVGIGHERFVIKGGDDTAFLLGRELALDTARGQLLSSALGRMSMGDVRRLKKEVVGSIGRGTASPVRAMFSREISDGDTLLAGEMVGVDEGLVIQELSRPEELEKLQHELAKQVSKLAELGELKWLEELEKLETEELGELLRLKARKASEGLRTLLEQKKAEEIERELKSALGLEKLEKLAELELVKQRLESMKELERELEAKKSQLEKDGLRVELEALVRLEADVAQLRELEKLKGLKEEIKEVKKAEKKLEEKKSELEQAVGKLKLEDLDRLEEIKLAEVKGKLGKLEAKKLEEVQEKVTSLGSKELEGKGLTREEIRALRELGKLEGKKLAELEKLKVNTPGLKELGKKLGETVKELAAIRELKEGPELEQMLKEIRLDLEEQLRMLAEVKDLKALAEKQKDEALDVQEILQLTTRTVALERNLVAKVSKLDRKSLESQKKVLEQEKLKLIKELAEKRKAKGLFGAVLDLGLVALGVGETKDWELVILEKKLAKINALLEGGDIAKLGRQIKRIRGLEDLAVSKKLKAALASAMEIAKNRGWTDYLNSLDVSERANAARELIAAEKIRKWARDINNLDADERAMVAGAFARAVEGAEVIEVRAIGSTSVMLNACYDLLTDGMGVVPYACAGIGGNFVSVVDGHINPKFAYRVKAGLSYALTPEISAFAGAFYHKVLGDGDYDELPLSHISDYTGTAGKNKDTGIASFNFAYFGGELGVRFAF
uniref:Major surface protein 3 n=1 Tax=Anaplasma marginale TaxID=770 RepID=Q84HV8_ANAMA|nr:major surface protein 3 [Anaplasma marginale str. Florida]